MTGKEDRDDPRSPAKLRAAFVKLTYEIEAVEHIGRHNRLVGRRMKITEQLIAAGGNTERELLLLLDDPSRRSMTKRRKHAFDRVRCPRMIPAKPGRCSHPSKVPVFRAIPLIQSPPDV
jgi:hypothetical protein